MAKRIRKTVRNGLLIGGSVITLAIIGILSTFRLDVPSLKEPGDATEQEVETTPTERLTSDAAPISDSPDAIDRASPEILDVLIDGDDYFVSDGVGAVSARQRMTASRISMTARELPGDAQGVKVLVRRTFDATAQAEQVLLDALTQGGLIKDQIDVRQQLVDSSDTQVRDDKQRE
tara:strand:- start:320185 stop:320712 length:528 start_codon:yes stop_codon:yes gene_type:complete